MVDGVVPIMVAVSCRLAVQGLKAGTHQTRMSSGTVKRVSEVPRTFFFLAQKIRRRRKTWHVSYS